MNNEYKKGFMEAIDGVLYIINEAGQELDKENKAFKYELKKFENYVLQMKVAFFECYYEGEDEPHLDAEGIIIPKDDVNNYRGTGMTQEEYLNNACKQRSL